MLAGPYHWLHRTSTMSMSGVATMAEAKANMGPKAQTPTYQGRSRYCRPSMSSSPAAETYAEPSCGTVPTWGQVSYIRPFPSWKGQ